MSNKFLSSSLANQAGLSPDLEQQSLRAGDDVWIDVIHCMDEIYVELVNSQVELEQKNSELENAQLFIESIISSISEILIVCDINGRILEMNQSLTTSLGIEAKQLINQPLSILFSPQYQAKVAAFPQHIRSGSLIDCEVDLLDVNQQAVPMSINCSARFNHEDRLSGMVITGRPLSELRQAYDELNRAHEELKTTQQRLIQSEKMASLGRLVAGVAHELNNPISFVFANLHALQGYHSKFRLYIDAIHQGANETERVALRKKLRIDKMMADIVPLIEGSMEGAERVSDIVKNLRKFSSPQKQNYQNLDLIPVIKRAISWVLKASLISIKVDENLPTELQLNNNEGYIHQILINLFQNAVDAMAQVEKPQLSIHIFQHEKQVDILVRDNGHGISEDNLAKIFDPFFTTKDVGTGTGLGLSISLGLATDQCQGNLQARNHPDGGAEFIFSLPLGNPA